MSALVCWSAVLQQNMTVYSFCHYHGTKKIRSLIHILYSLYYTHLHFM